MHKGRDRVAGGASSGTPLLAVRGARRAGRSGVVDHPDGVHLHLLRELRRAVRGPRQLPPTATFSTMKNGLSNTHGLPLVSAGVTVLYATPSTDQVIDPGFQSTANVWKVPRTTSPAGAGSSP